MNYLADLGAPREKLLLGIPFYGQTFELQSDGKNGIGAPSTGPGQAGEYTRQPGMLGYYEICDRIKNQRWITMKDRNSGPYTYNRRQWVSYDSIESAEEKVRAFFFNNA